MMKKYMKIPLFLSLMAIFLPLSADQPDQDQLQILQDKKREEQRQERQRLENNQVENNLEENRLDEDRIEQNQEDQRRLQRRLDDQQWERSHNR
jgi:hypothetical protein